MFFKSFSTDFQSVYIWVWTYFVEFQEAAEITMAEFQNFSYNFVYSRNYWFADLNFIVLLFYGNNKILEAKPESFVSQVFRERSIKKIHWKVSSKSAREIVGIVLKNSERNALRVLCKVFRSIRPSRTSLEAGSVKCSKIVL